jgi:hypothetical protein
VSSIDLGAPTKQAELPTNDRIAKYASGGDEDLAALLFQFGRYLMIAARASAGSRSTCRASGTRTCSRRGRRRTRPTST